jgi:cytidyltransferase-like protein
MMDDLDLDALLVTRSEKGMLLVEAGARPLFLSTQAREVYDVTGAGDTVIATLAGALASGQDLASSAALANIAAGLVVRKIGVATVTPGEISAALHQRGQGGRGLVELDALLALVEESRSRNERIVMTNGHAGHVSYLEEAKSLGDRLIVAVNDDASVKRLKGDSRPINALEDRLLVLAGLAAKGDSRPINALEDRLLVLAGLAAVDWVVPFAEDTPARLIQAILPDVLVKGGDYKPDEIVGGSRPCVPRRPLVEPYYRQARRRIAEFSAVHALSLQSGDVPAVHPLCCVLAGSGRGQSCVFRSPLSAIRLWLSAHQRLYLDSCGLGRRSAGRGTPYPRTDRALPGPAIAGYDGYADRCSTSALIVW